MIKLKNLLVENMMRFGPKNLTEWDQRKLKQLLKEQTNTYEEPDARTGNYLQRDVPSAEWQIDGFTAPEINNMSDSGITSFKDAYRTYMDFSTGLVGKTLIVFKNAKSITDCVFDPKNVHLRIKIQSSYVPGPKAKDVAAQGYVGQDNCIQIWETKQATRNFELATKTAVFKSDNSTLASDKQPASITLLADGNSISSGVADPTGGYVSVSGQYKIFQDYSVRQMGVLVGYCPINFSGDSVHKTEGWGSVLVSKGYQEAAAW